MMSLEKTSSERATDATAKGVILKRIGFGMTKTLFGGITTLLALKRGYKVVSKC
jgi:hypothetical protein